MNLLAPISSIMTKNLITIKPDDSIAAIGDLFLKHRFHHLPVLEGNKLIGIVSKSDYLFFRRGYSNETRMDEQRIQKHTAKEIMVKGIAKLESSDKINVTLEIFKENILHAIPIVDNEELVGIVTPLDIIKHLADDKEITKEY
jgi:CBS domain-containing protein